MMYVHHCMHASHCISHLYKSSVSFRYWMRSTMLVKTNPCCLQNLFISGRRIISVGWSSETISHSIPARDRPAKWARSIPASVWPSRVRTPPLQARNGKMCPGRTKSAESVDMSAKRFIVLARSTELIPVVMPATINKWFCFENCRQSLYKKEEENSSVSIRAKFWNSMIMKIF